MSGDTVMNHGSESTPRILVAIASWGTKNDQYLLQLVQEYRSMSFRVDIVVLSNLPKQVVPGIEVIVVDLRGKNPWSLPFPHKQLFASRVNDYDLFIYSEDDTLITERNIRAFLKLSAELPENEIPGFFRFEQGTDGAKNFPEMHGHFHWDPQSVRVRGQYVLAAFTNEHSACYMLTRQQLRRAIDSGGFLVEPHEGKYDLLCTAATDPYTQCGVQKLICISHIEDFLVHHMPNKYMGSSFGVDEPELRRQLDTIMRIGLNGHRPESLLQTETRLPASAYSKGYYEPARIEILLAIPAGTKSVLSVGCGWGATETALIAKGMRVTGVPLDPVIAGAAEAKGVSTVKGNLQAACEKLAKQRFECVLISNVLHLVADPVHFLASFGRFVSEGGVVVIVVPNLLRLSTYWSKFRRDKGYRDLGNYEKTGCHLTSHRIVRGWLRSAGMRPANIVDILSPRAQRFGRFMLSVSCPVLASEIVATGISSPNTASG